MSRAHVIRPAGAGHETLYVLLVSLLIVVLAATVVMLRGEREDEQTIASHQIDARRDLTAAEQGLYTDLRVAFDTPQVANRIGPEFDGVDMVILGHVHEDHMAGLHRVPQAAVQRFAAGQGWKCCALGEHWAQRKLLLCARSFEALPRYAGALLEALSAD